MGCVSSKLVKKELREEEEDRKIYSHVVSLTSSTYGVLNLDKDPEEKIQQNEQIKEQEEEMGVIIKEEQNVVDTKKTSPPRDSLEVINTWELMQDLEEGEPVHVSIPDKKGPKALAFLRGFDSPKKFFNQMATPKKLKRSVGKENKGFYNGSNFSPKGFSSSCPNSIVSIKKAHSEVKCEVLRNDLGVLPKRRSLSPLFGKTIVSSADKEIDSENSISKRALDLKNDKSVLDLFEKKCPRGGEDSVVIYTTSLRGIRKTFEACNNVRSIMGSYDIQIIERDVSMDSSFKEDLRGLMGTKEVKVPVVFVKGRLIGGAEEVNMLEDEGTLGNLLEGIPRAAATCRRCGGVRFVMCSGCNGSCKVLDENNKKKKKRCGKCNENGLIQCPICC